MSTRARQGKAPFRGLLAATLISTAGTSMSAIAIPWLVLSRTGSAAMTGVVAFAQMITYVIAQMLSGPIVDRAGLRRSFVAGNVVAALLVGAIPIADAAAGGLPMPGLIVLVAVAGAVRGAADTAGGALVPSAAELGGIAMERAAGLSSGAQRSALLLGAPLGGALVATVGPGAAIAVDAATFAVGALVVGIAFPAGARSVSAAASGSAVRRYVRDLAEGFAFVRKDRLLLGLVTMILASNLLDQGFSEVMIPVWVKRELGTPGALGVIGAVSAVGMVAGNLIGAWLGPRVSRLNLYRVGFLLSGGPRLAVLAFATTLAPVLGVFLVTETFGGSLNPVIGATAYERIPEELRARALGLIRAMSWIGVPFGALLGGLAVQVLGLRAAVIVFAAAYFVTTLAPFVLPVWRELKRPEAAAARPPVTQAAATSD